MKRKTYFSMASAAVIALVIALNLTGTIGSKNITKAAVQTDITVNNEALGKPQIEVPVNLEVEKGDQKNADAGSSPWRLDPVFIAQVFVSLQISPDGIVGDYPIKLEELNLGKNTEEEAVVEISSGSTAIKKVYLKRLIRQDDTGIWTVVGYDSAS